MDHYGIGAAVEGAASVYFRSARGSGRTTSLIESLNDGDRVVFSTAREASRFASLCKERGLKIKAIVLEQGGPEELFSGRFGSPSEGRTVFDHSWVEEFYLNAILDAQGRIDRVQREASGKGEAHAQTRLAAQEFSKWR